MTPIEIVLSAMLVAPTLSFWYWIKNRPIKSVEKVSTSQAVINVTTTTEQVKKIYQYQPPMNTSCPMCDQLYKKNSHKFCDCSKYPVGHFHITCTGNYLYGSRKGQPCGCGFQWMMKGKDN